MTKLPSLDTVLAYENKLVIRRFKEDRPEHADEAERLFKECLKYLWLCQKYEFDKTENPNDPKLDFQPVMHQEMIAIDMIWHEFILITKQYHDFCNAYFGEYIHHTPNMREDNPYTEERFKYELDLFLEYVYDNLGSDSLIYWFKEHFEDASLEQEQAAA